MIAVKFDPERPLGAPWTHDSTMYLHSAIVMALETLGLASVPGDQGRMGSCVADPR